MATLALLCCAFFSRSQNTTSGAQTTTVTLSNSVKATGIDRPGINLGGIGGYGSQQLLKSLMYAGGGSFPGTYAATTYTCSQGGSNTTTTWYSGVGAAYPANFWAGGTFTAINTGNGTSYGSGTITASTPNTGTNGITFTLSPAISAACNPNQTDVLIVRLNKQNTLISPATLLDNQVCSNASWNTTDTSPASTNTQQSLQMPNGCFLNSFADAIIGNRTNSNGLASQPVNFINLNGSYTATFKAKCAVEGCSLNFNFGRSGGISYINSTTVNPAYSGSQGAGWTTYTYPFNAVETAPPGQNLVFGFTCTGTCLMQDVDVVEASTLPGNTTVFRDAVVYELQKLHPGSLRYMDPSQWCSDVADEIAATGNRRWCGANPGAPGSIGQAIGYNDVLALANLIGSDVMISVGALNQPADWATLINWLNTSGWISAYAASGHTIYLEDGNEAWNQGAGGNLSQGVGPAYGYTLGVNMAAAKAASGYNSNVIKLVGNSFGAGAEGYGTLGWIQNAMVAAQAIPNGLPDFVDVAPYLLNYLGNFDTSGSNVSTTGAPFLDVWAEMANIDSVTSPPAYTQSMYLNQQYAKSNFGVGTIVYEVNEATYSGVAATQLQLNQIDASVGNALATTEHVLLMQRDAQVTGPIHVFTLAEPYTGYGCSGCSGNPVMPLWGANLMMATGPGQTPGAANVDRPLAVALSVINNAIGTNKNLMSVTQSGTPTFNYPGGQYQGGSPSILSNSAVPYVNCFAYSDGQNHWTAICFNNNLTTAQSVTLAGAGAPTGSVTQTIFPSASNVITDNNENIYLGASSIAPVVIAPTATTASGTTYSIPPASFIALSYSVSGLPVLAAPTFSVAAGTYPSTQTVSLSFPAGSTACVGINTTPTASTAGTCGAGGTAYTGPITVSTSQTINAIATAAGSTNSSVATASYTINAALPAPTFTPAAGTYTSAQSVTITDAVSGTAIYYTTNGSTPTGASTPYSGAVTVSSSQTLQAIAVKSGYTNSPVASAAYTITIAAAPTVATACFQGSGSSSLTLGPLNTTGANTIALVVASFNVISSVTDNMGNGNATGLTASSGGSPNNQIFYWQTPNVGSAHTITVNGNGGLYASACVFVMSGVTGTFSGAQSASYAGYGSPTCQAGSITPSSGPQIIIAGFGAYTPSGAPTIDSSYTLGAYQPGQGGTAFGEAAAYSFQPAGAATNPKWTWGNNATSPACVIAAFAGGAGSPTASTPTFSLAGGTYTTAQNVTIADATAGATIYYTTDGSTPTTSSNIYSNAITVSATQTLQAIAVKTGYTNSPSASVTYTISPVLPAPTFSPAAGSFTAPQSVTISDATAGTTIYYTTNGTAPTTSSSVYTGSIAVNSSQTLQAIAVKTGYTVSPASSAVYVINSTLPAPTFSPGSGTYTAPPSSTGADYGLHLHGDSITTPAGAGCSKASLCYDMLLNAEIGWNTSANTNDSTNGDEAEDMNVKVFTHENPVATNNNPIQTTLIGTNDVLQIGTSPGYLTSFAQVQAATHAWLGLANTDKIAGSTAAVTGTCSNDTTYPNITGKQCTVSNSTVTWPNVTAPNGVIYLWYRAFQTSSGSATCKVDGALATDTLTSSTTLIAQALTGLPTGNHVADDVQLARFAGYSTTAPHTIACTNSNTFSYVGLGLPPGTRYPGFFSPKVAMGGVLYQQNDASSAVTAAYHNQSASIASLLYGDNLNVLWFNNRNYVDAVCDMGALPHTAQCPESNSPPVHPSDVGHRHIANGFEDTLHIAASPAPLTVALSNTASGVTTYYTTDGTTPTTASNLYSGPIKVSASETISALATAAGYTNSPVATATYTINSVLNAPTFSPAAGTYTGTQSVTLTSSTAGSTIYYTTNGTTPTTSSSVYTGPISVSASQTIQAIAVQSGYTNSAVASAAYTINVPVLPAPTFSLAAGTYTGTQSVSITDATSGTTIYYTTNGSTPTTSSSIYTGSISVTASQTLQAIAVASGYTNSPLATAAYTINIPVLPAPTFSLAAGTYTGTQSVSITDATSGTTIYYTTNGSTPTTSSSVYTGSISVTASQTIQAIAVQSGYTNSPVATAAYTINVPVLPTPTFSPAAGTYTTTQSVSITDATSGTTIYYTTNGSTPTTASAVYSSPISVSASQTIQAIAVASGYTNSPVATAAYTINTPVLPAPTFTPAAGTYTSIQSVAIAEATSGATIYYTTDSSTPTTASPVYTGPITVSTSQTIQAIAVKSGSTNSPVATAVYTINTVLPAPTISPAGGTYTSSQTATITITEAVPGTTIYYSNTGFAPNNTSSVYTGPITISTSQTIKAFAVKIGSTDSPVATAAFTFNPPLSAPTFFPAAGSYTGTQSVSIGHDQTSTVYYTTNGTSPTSGSSVYTGPITVSSSQTILAIAAKSGYADSPIGYASYTITPIATPTVATACYQGSGSSSLNLGPLNTTGASTIALVVSSFNVIGSVTDNMGNGKATALNAASGNSPNNQIFYWQAPAVGANHTITVNGNSGLYASACVFVMSGVSGTYSNVQNASSSGYTSSSCQAGSITPPSGTQVIIAGFGTYGATSAPTIDSSFTLGGYQAGTPGSSYGEAAAYLLQSAGSTVNPTWNWPNNATTPGCVIAAFGGSTAPTPTAATPVFSIPGATYTSPLTLTITDSTSGATIYYTTNGATPTTSSSVYTAPITISASQTIRAIAVASGYNNSSIASATYNINTSTPVCPTTANTNTDCGFLITINANGTITGAPVPGANPYNSYNDYLIGVVDNSGKGYVGSITLTGIGNGAGIFAFTGHGICTVVFVSGCQYGSGYQGPNNTLSGSGTKGTINLFGLGATGNYFSLEGLPDSFTIPLLPAPTFTPASGTYTSVQSVTIADAVSGASIYYSTVGYTPSPTDSNSTLYTGPITVSSTQTLYAAAFASGYANSTVSSSGYLINIPTLLAPTFSPSAGTYTGTQSVSISNATSGTTIYYTTNGTVPTTASSVYTGPITVSASQTIQAIAVKSGSNTSNVGSAAYTIIPLLPAPTFTPAAGTYASTQTVSIAEATSGTTIYYTTDTTTPTSASAVYTGPITISTSQTIKAFAVETGYTDSAVATAAYTIAQTLPAPTFSPAAGTYTTAQSVRIGDAMAGVTIYYTADGSTPTTSSTIANGFITVSASQTLQALAVKSGYTNSTVASAVYAINPVLPAPTFSPGGGTYYTAPQLVTITDAMPGTTIYYTTDGYTPTTSSSVYTGPVSISVSSNLSAIAVKDGYTNSPLTIAAYTLYPLVPTPTFSPAGGTYTAAQSVSISDTLADATIYYTTDNTTPTTASKIYSGPITVYSSQTLQAFAAKTGLYNSNYTFATYTINSLVLPPPTFSPAGGTFTASQYVTISDAIAGSTIYYTTNGTTPTTASSVYTSPFIVSTSQTIQAIAVKSGYTSSPISTSTYNINPVLPAPTFSPAAGAYTSAQSITISEAISGTTIYYTTNGTTPTTSSAIYTGPINVAATQTLTAMAVAPNYTNSFIGSAAYTIQPALLAPTFSPPAANYPTAQSVTITEAISGATIYYTTNGSTPSTASSVYTGPINIANPLILQAIAIEAGYTSSPVTLGSYTIYPLPTPTFSPAAGSYTSAQSVTISEATSGATIYYTTNGTTPTTASSVYTGPITVSATQTLQALAVASSGTLSYVASGAYTINIPTLPAPTFSPTGGTYTSAQSVSITDATSGTTIYYTTNGVTPTTASSVYTGPVTVSASQTIQAIAVKSGSNNSAVASAAYTINIPVLPAPTFSPAGGTYTTSQSITISDATSGTTIYYTTNGSPPTTASNVYTSPITVSTSQTIQAIAVKSGSTNSPIGSSSYTISPVLPAPTFSPAGGTYTSAQSVTITDATAGTTIYYTTNGATPTTSSSIYSGPITVSASQTIQAIAAASGYTNSPVASATYTLNIPVPGPAVATTCYQGSSAGTLTTGPINTIGASTIVLAVSSFDALGSVTDNKGNGNATALTGTGSSPHNQLFYWQTPATGNGHTFTVNGNSGLYASACVFVISNTTGVYSGVQNNNATYYGSPTCQTGITPSSSPQVIITAFGVYGPSSAPTIDSGYTLGAYQPGQPGQAFAEAAGYLIQPAGAATSPLWTWPTTAATPSCVIAAFH